MIELSDELNEKLYGDAAVLAGLLSYEEAYKAGRKYVLFEALSHCAQFQVVIPEWAADALLTMQRNLEDGDEKDLNSAFGWDDTPKESRNKAARSHDARVKENRKKVIEALWQHRLQGGTLNADEGLALVAEQLGLSRRLVEDIYRESGEFIKNMPRDHPSDINTGFFMATLPGVRRRGRKLICDCKEEC